MLKFKKKNISGAKRLTTDTLNTLLTIIQLVYNSVCEIDFLLYTALLINVLDCLNHAHAHAVIIPTYVIPYDLIVISALCSEIINIL